MNYQPSTLSYGTPNHLVLFKFTGAIIGRAIIQGITIDAHLTRPFLNNILNRETVLKDIEDFDETIFKSLNDILNHDMDSDSYIPLYFEVDHPSFDKTETYELVNNGSEIKVTNENKQEFVQHLIEYYSTNSIECPIQAFCEGFDSFIPFNYISLFGPSELDLVISGPSEIDINDMRKNTIYEGKYNEDHPVVILFFESISKWDQIDLGKLLMFITGSSKVPANGFEHYTNQNIPIKIIPGGDKDRLPEAHTCFNILCLPEYETEDELNMKFKEAIKEVSFKIK